MPRKKLKWGQTPFHKMTKAQLLAQSIKMYDALVSTRSVLRQYELGYEDTPYWSRQGSGRRALEKANQVVEPMETAYGSDQIYRNYYRYANDLLWDKSKADFGHDWTVCPVCGIMLGSLEHVGQTCDEALSGPKKCQGVMRQLTWDDIKPQTK